jgi:hypothetical protein
MKKTLTRSKGGAAEREVDILALNIPDLWHIAQWLKTNKLTKEKPVNDWMKLNADMILDCWHLAHDMRRMLQEELRGK